MKGTSEANVRAALARLFDDELGVAYKLPDDARNWKPCDFFCWTEGRSAWLEVKQTTNRAAWPLKDLRSSQRRGVYEAQRLGIDYWLVVYWKARNHWTVSRLSIGLLDEADLPFARLSSTLGVDCDTAHLSGVLGDALSGGL